MSLRTASPDLPRGFSFSAAACGLKKSGLDVALLVSENLAAAACVFTTNQVQAAPIVLSRRHLERTGGRARAIIVNSGNANCATGRASLDAARVTAARVANSLACRPEEVLVCSTGVIGVPLRVERILKAIPILAANGSARTKSFAGFARAIMTTDTRPKWAAAKCRIGGKTARLLGCAKGAGMIHPRMATMLAFIATDAAISPALLLRALRKAVAGTFNAISVDGDRSTNDTAAVLASGVSGCRAIRAGSGDYTRFSAALEGVCRSLAIQIVADGEGAQRVIEITVRGAPSDRAADQVARAIANSPLVKTAFAGADPNWGRILAAAGQSGVAFNPAGVEIRMAGILVCRRGSARPFQERAVRRKLRRRHVRVVVDLHAGNGQARVWTCDFTSGYVHVNAGYRS